MSELHSIKHELQVACTFYASRFTQPMGSIYSKVPWWNMKLIKR